MPDTRPGFGALLHARRDRLSPADAGFTATAGRRAPGLRREELAQLAGLSVDYVLRLEQGRANHPSAQVVGALARALQLTHAERDELYLSAGLLPPQDGLISDHVPPGIQRLAVRLGDVPIGVFTAAWNLVWWNEGWGVLHSEFSGLPATERNVARAHFGIGPAQASLFAFRSDRGQEVFGASIVAGLKDAVIRYPTDPGLGRLVRDLRAESADFARLWDTEAANTQHMTNRKTVRHPEIGDIEVDCDVLLVPGADLRMVTYTAAAGSTDAGKLDLLGAMGGRSARSQV